MHKIKYLPDNENGSVIIVAIFILALLTVLGLSAITTSTTEQHLATNTLLYERAFYAAEAGFEHAKGILKVPYVEQNQSNIALGNRGRLAQSSNCRDCPGQCCPGSARCTVL